MEEGEYNSPLMFMLGEIFEVLYTALFGTPERALIVIPVILVLMFIKSIFD